MSFCYLIGERSCSLVTSTCKVSDVIAQPVTVLIMADWEGWTDLAEDERRYPLCWEVGTDQSCQEVNMVLKLPKMGSYYK